MLPHKPECGSSARKILRTQFKKGNGRLGKQAMEVAFEENDWRIEVQGE